MTHLLAVPPRDATVEAHVYGNDMADQDFEDGPEHNFPSSSTTSSQSSRKFNLDEQSDRSILVYKMRSGYEISSQKKLCRELDKDLRWRCSKKPIDRGTSRLDVKTCDLWNEPERSAYCHYPNAKSNIASVGLPRSVYWRRMLFGHFQDLYILSPESSENSSRTTSPEDTAESSPDGPTPSNTFQVAGDRT